VTKARFSIVGSTFALLVLLPLLLVSAGGATPPPPEGWSASDWNALPADKQDQELEAYPSAVGGDPQAKAAWLATKPPIEPSIAADAAVDGPGAPYSTGIQDSAYSTLPNDIYRITNSWSALSSDGQSIIRVYAGKRTDMTAQSGAPMGFIDVRHVPYPSGSPVVENEYRHACASGPLTISSGTLSQIVLSDALGAIITFDLSTRTFTPACASAQ
jgi:hypothetical protein